MKYILFIVIMFNLSICLAMDANQAQKISMVKHLENKRIALAQLKIKVNTSIKEATEYGLFDTVVEIPHLLTISDIRPIKDSLAERGFKTTDKYSYNNNYMTIYWGN